MGGVILVRKTDGLVGLRYRYRRLTHDLTSGNHCVVRVGHSNAVLLGVKDLSSPFVHDCHTSISCHTGRGCSSSMSCILPSKLAELAQLDL
jgi:hypothetical protein